MKGSYLALPRRGRGGSAERQAGCQPLFVFVVVHFRFLLPIPTQVLEPAKLKNRGLKDEG